MGGLTSFLIFAVFFYIMMKFGCGSHMTHGHHHKKDKVKSLSVYDPVCGVLVDENEGYGKLQDGSLFRFCSKKCLDEFDRQPEKYAANTNSSKQLEQEHHHDA